MARGRVTRPHSQGRWKSVRGLGACGLGATEAISLRDAELTQQNLVLQLGNLGTQFLKAQILELCNEQASGAEALPKGEFNDHPLILACVEFRGQRKYRKRMQMRLKTHKLSTKTCENARRSIVLTRKTNPGCKCFV